MSTPLQQLVKSRLAELDLTYRAAAERSGGLISHSSLNFVATGRMTAESLQPRLLRGLALALDVSPSEVEKAVRESGAHAQTKFTLPKKADRLGPKQRKAVLALIDALLDNSAPAD